MTTRPSPRNTTYWYHVIRDAFTAEWGRMYNRGALACLPIIAAWIFIGVIHRQESWATFAIAGAMSAAFGAFQKLGESQAKAMALLLAGIAVAAWAGSVAGFLGWYYWAMLATICGLGFGALTTLGYGAWWMGLQWMIALVVYGSHAAGPLQAGQNALAVIAGGVSEILFLAVLGRSFAPWFPKQDQPPFASDESFRQSLEQIKNLNFKDDGGRYALRVAAGMAMATTLSHLWGLPNGYWTPMTVIILLKPDFRKASVRGISRVLGTLLGAGVVTLSIAVARPSPVVLGCLLLSAIWACLTFMRVNYALFAAWITAYVVLLFSTLGLPEPTIAFHRVLATLAGAAIALVVSLPPTRVVAR
jgi:hypothetical protein